MNFGRRHKPPQENPVTLVHEILRKADEIMADVTALTAAVTELQTEAAAAVTAITTEPTPTQAEVDAITANVTAVSTELKTALTPPAPVEEPPAPTPAA